jgi:hypothetical protein
MLRRERSMWGFFACVAFSFLNVKKFSLTSQDVSSKWLKLMKLVWH